MYFLTRRQKLERGEVGWQLGDVVEAGNGLFTTSKSIWSLPKVGVTYQNTSYYRMQSEWQLKHTLIDGRPLVCFLLFVFF
jgi:hypothetical protein